MEARITMLTARKIIQRHDATSRLALPSSHIQRGQFSSAPCTRTTRSMQSNMPGIHTHQPPTLRKPSTYSGRHRTVSIHWLFRTNIPRRRTSLLPNDIHKRNFFGMGEIVGVLTNPAETVRSLTESKRLLDEARREISENRERAQLRTKHTFSRLPGFFPRREEVQTIERALEGEPSFTVLFGASSVGKTALLREVLCSDKYHVLHFDLRIAGFADLASLYTSLSQQMEQYFEEMAHLEGYEEFEKEAWSFKHDRISVQDRKSDVQNGSSNVKTSDVARLMELFQSSLLKYWEFQPCQVDRYSPNGKRPRRQDSDVTSDGTRVDHSTNGSSSKFKWGFRSRMKGKNKEGQKPSRNPQLDEGAKEKERAKPSKKMPIIFFDEAHKLPALIQSTEAMKCLLDSMLVLTKQDRLCHVIHATSDPFYQTWLRQLNVMQHCKIISVGDCSKAETRAYFRERILPRVPDRLQPGLTFEKLYDAFGGKLAHWHDYVTDYVNCNGNLEVKQSSHFLQAHSLLNLHIIHSSQASPAPQGDTAAGSNHNPESIHPGLGPAGFKVYSPISGQNGPSSSFAALSGEDRTNAMVAGYYSADFTAMQLLKVMSRLTQPDVTFLPYFLLCRELGVRAVDGMVKGKVLDLRWTETVTKENIEETRARGAGMGLGIGTHLGAGSSGTAVELPGVSEEDDMVAVSERDLGPEPPYEEVMDIVGPKLVAMTPIMRYAMREVVEEYEDEQSVSEYASLSDVDEY